MIQTIVPYRSNIFKEVLFVLLCFLSLGLVYIIATWHYKFWAILRMSKCDVYAAEYFRINAENTQTIVNAEHYTQQGLDYIVRFTKGFTFRYHRYICRQGKFEIIEFHLHKNHDAHQKIADHQQLLDLQNLYGINSTEIPRKPIHYILIEELMHPLFVVQLLQIMLWIYEQYTSYAIILLLTSIVSMIDTLFEYRESYREIRLNSKFEHDVTVIRFGKRQTINSRELVPGDVIAIEPFRIICCDCVLIKGTCIVQEQFLTGEQSPILKLNINDDDEDFIPTNKMLYMSTQCLRADEDCLAFVVATGFNTQKGQLISEVMLTPDYSFNFYEDSLQYLKYLGLVAVVGYLIALPFKIYYLITYPFIEPTDLITDILDLLAVCVPPTLPTTLQIGLSLALKRFKKKRIYCFNPSKINLAGVVSSVCFDKTGTLTEEEQRVFAILEMNHQGNFVKLTDLNESIQLVMACCNNIVNDEEIIYGDHLDIALFKFTKAKISNRTVDLNGKSYEIVKTFEFTQELQRISCIVYSKNKLVLVKGAPEKLKSLCTHVPSNYTQVFKYYAHHGYKVIACAYKELNSEDVIPTREHCESELNFLCLVVLENRVKDNSQQVIQQLRSAKVETILVTGDDVLTSIKVARQTQLVDEVEPLVYGDLIDGRVDWKDVDQQFKEIESQMNQETKIVCLEELNPISKFNIEAKSCEQLVIEEDNLNRKATLAMTGRLFIHFLNQAHESKDFNQFTLLINRTRIYAKMRREHKAELIKILKKHRMFCGDGGADIQAMRTADVGVSLTNMKLSLAAPFTSGQEDLSTVLHILIEGRGALTTSFQCFEYMTMCSLVQFLSCTLLYFQYSYMTNSQFLVLDLAVVLPISVLMSYTENLNKLTQDIPQQSLLSVEVLSTIIGQFIIQSVFQTVVYIALIEQDWYHDPITLSNQEYGEAGFIQSFEATSLFFITNYQYITLAIALSYAPKFKRPFYSNRPFTLYMLALLIFELYLFTKYSTDTEDDYLNLTFKVKQYIMPKSWLLFLAAMIIVNSTLTQLYQVYGIPRIMKHIKQ